MFEYNGQIFRAILEVAILTIGRLQLKYTNQRHPISVAIRKILLVGIATSIFAVPTLYGAEETEESEEEATITITGSRLSRTDVESAAPLHVITADDIQANGFTTAFEAIKSLTQVNGSSQGAQDGGTFTQGADSINLRAIGPGRTLTLINGRRMADYPLPFNGQSNIVNVANIPAIMIDRIEVLSSGASAIYGSDAIAGVFNIILKDNVEGMHVSARIGDTSDGGGASQRLQFTAGKTTENLNVVYGIEMFKRDPIMAFERDFMDSYKDNPDVISGATSVVNSRSFLILDPFRSTGPTSYVDPGAATCDPLTDLARGSIEYSYRPGAGYYCGTADDIGFSSIRNAKDTLTGFLNLNYELNSDHDLFSTIIITDSETEFDVGTNFWQYEGGLDTNDLGRYFLNEASPDVFGIGGRPELWQRIFTPEEVADNNNHSNETAIDVTVGARGEFFAGFEYEASFSLSKYDLKRERRLIDKASADLFFLGPVTGTSDFGFGVWNIHDAPASNMYRQLTQDEFLSISGIDTTKADSQNVTASFILTNEEMWQLPAGDVGFALVLEAGSQEYSIDLDPKLINREWFGFTGTGGGGERDRIAVGTEFSVPITEDLTASIAARWDKYDDVTNVDDATTYNLGLEYRPVENLLLRGTIATSFRAPDMHFVYADPSGFFTSATDQYLCRLQGQVVTSPSGSADYTNCIVNIGVGGSVGLDGTYGIEGARQGSTFLEEETGESMTIGFVYDITDEMSITLDYYSIKLENVVRDNSISSLLELEANCRLGSNFSGTETFDIGSGQCQNALANVTRGISADVPNSDFIDTVTTGPINAAIRETAGFDVAFDYALFTDSMGEFRFNVNYNITDKDQDQISVDDDVRDLRNHMQIFNYRSQVTATTNWRYDDFSTTLFARRTGSLPNWAETERCCGRTTVNMSVAYEATEDLSILFIVNNLQNKSPQVDPTFNSYPYYFTGQVDAYGREYSIQVDYAFGY